MVEKVKKTKFLGLSESSIPREVKITVENGNITGNLTIPKDAKGIVIFAHGSGSGRFSPRNQFVANELNKAGIATLLIDLLTKDEELIDEATAELRFDIPFLAKRLNAAIEYIGKDKDTKALKIGLFGASTGAAAALISAAEYKEIAAVVSRGGRPDLAIEYCGKVKAPVLLIVGSLDEQVIEMNKEAFKHLKCEKKLEIVPGATHLFEEPGKLEEAARLAKGWFKRFFK